MMMDDLPHVKDSVDSLIWHWLKKVRWMKGKNREMAPILPEKMVE